LLALPTRISVDEVARTLKSITTKKLMEEFPELRRYLWCGTLWTRGLYLHIHILMSL
jgi:REP element-mobilizing transposase RayT